jgi:hypothetical protein
MTAIEDRALRILVAESTPPRSILVRPQHFGELLWPDTKHHSSNCSAPLARPAGKVLQRLKGYGFAEQTRNGDSWGWRATGVGRAYVAHTGPEDAK